MPVLEGKEACTTAGAEWAPPQLYLVAAAVFHYLGPSFAVLLFERVPVEGVAWLRIVSAAAVFAVWRRPWMGIRGMAPRSRRTLVALGVVLATMNLAFYEAIDRLPLGTVAAIEFAGPVALALSGTRTLRNVAAVGLAIGGVWLLGQVRLAGSFAGFAWAMANAVLFTLYIHLAHRVARGRAVDPLRQLGIAMLVASVAITPIGLPAVLPALTDPVALGAGLGIGVTSSVIPYALDQFAMIRVSRSTYSVFVALLPATALVIGALVLHQVPTALEATGVLMIVVAVLAHSSPR